MKTSSYNKLTWVLLLGLAGCASSGTRVISQTNANGGAVRIQTQQAINAWEQQRDYDGAMMQFHRLSGYSGGGFKCARLTVTALIELERGDREAFINIANDLAMELERFPRSYVNGQTRHVITVAYAMQGKDPSDLPGHGYDERRVRTVYQLLDTNW